MYTRLISAILLVVGLAVAIPSAFAQSLDYSGDPLYGRLTLSSSNTEDSISMTSGGAISVRSLFPNSDTCRGYAATEPDVTVRVNSTSFTRLMVEFDSRADTTLIVRAPNGSWYCDDDTNGLDPQVVIANPRQGNYQIWVGSYRSGEYHSGTLSVSGFDYRPHAVLCINNDTNITVNYDYRWGTSGSWQSTSVGAGLQRWHSWDYSSGQRSSPTFYIRFDEDLTSRNYYREYTLERYATDEETCENGYQYEFDYLNSSRIDLFDIED